MSLPPPLPNLALVLVQRWQATAGITALTDNRIATKVGDDWFATSGARKALLMEGPKGAPVAGSDRLIGVMLTRYDLYFYGTDYADAMELWRAAHPYICPTADYPDLVPFIQGGVRVFDVYKEGGPTSIPDTMRQWPCVLATYVWKWGERAASL